MEENKKLIINDLLGRLLYHPYVRAHNSITNQYYESYITFANFTELMNVKWDIKVYLRPMSSMTNEEVKEFESLGWRVDELDNNSPWPHNGSIDSVIKGIDWLNSKQLDFRGLIEKGLAIKITKNYE